MIKKILLLLSLIPGILIILIVAVAKRLTSGFDSESIDFMLDYVSAFDDVSGGNGASIMFFLHQINIYSHWIITASIIWIVVVIYLMINRRKNNEK